MIELTKSAVAQLTQFSKDEDIGHLNVRVKIIGGGCSGLKHDMFFDDLEPTEMDDIFTQDGIKIYIDCVSSSYMQGGVLLDFISTEYTAGFKFISKNEDYSSCGCGQSFSPN